MTSFFTEENDFYCGTTPDKLIQQYGSPLYVYNEGILRRRCREMKNLVSYPEFKVNYSAKANTNIELLKIIRSEGLNVDAMSPGEIYLLLAAGYEPEEIFYVGNNVSSEEMRFSIERGITVSVDSVSQLVRYGKLNPGGKVAIRFNPGIGLGHHEKVMTAGKKTKFGVDMEFIPNVKEVLHEYNLKLTGINQHVGSLFLNYDAYLDAVKELLQIANKFEDLEFIDIGGGFGIPYHKREGQGRLDLKALGEMLDELMNHWTDIYGKKVIFKTEPGRYIPAECGVLLGTVNAIKKSYDVNYIGTDIGFNVLARPVIYDSFHELEIYRSGCLLKSELSQIVTVVGNICETGDILAKDRLLPQIAEGDILGVMDAGAYGYAMSSNYNCRLRPAEVLIRQDGTKVLIRKRDTPEDLLRNFTGLS